MKMIVGSDQEFAHIEGDHRTRGPAACRPLTSLQGDLFLTSRYDPFESARTGEANFEGEALNREGSENKRNLLNLKNKKKQDS